MSKDCYSTRTDLRNPARRRVLQGAATAAVALSAPAVITAATPGVPRRVSMTSEEGKAHLDTYRKAVDTMLSLPASDPHNWHRYALIHLMDCPHMNWWFFSWHRPYIGNFEQIIRRYGEDERFALPYWDWTADQYVDETMLLSEKRPDNPLDPRSSKFPEWDQFQDDFHDVLEKVWSEFNDQQLLQLDCRGYPDFDEFWNGNRETESGVEPNFTKNRASARSKTIDHPELTDPPHKTVEYVQFHKYKAGLTTPNFVTTRAIVNGKPTSIGGLNTSRSFDHHHTGSKVVGSLVEGQPHNLVHNDLGSTAGGWMPSLLSSVDPIFFLHHCNVDRLWDIWTRRQRLNGRSPYPAETDAVAFNREPFLFYIDVDKETAPRTAMQAMNINPDWDYSYSDGTGSELAVEEKSAGTLFAAQTDARGSASINPKMAEAISIAAPAALVDNVNETDLHQVAHIVLAPPANLRGVSFDVYVSPQGDAPTLSPDASDFAGSFQSFGMARSHGLLGFSIDISKALQRLHQSGVLKPDGMFDVTVVTTGGDGDQMATHEAALKSVSIETTSSG